MIRKMSKQKGFTLIEMIVVLVLVGIMSVFAGMAIIYGVNGYMLSNDNTVIGKKAQLALARINLELLGCYNCTGTSGSLLTSMPILNSLGQRYIRLNAGNIEISPDNYVNKDILINNVNSFTLDYITGSQPYDRIIHVTIGLNHPESATPIVFSTDIYPRNN